MISKDQVIPLLLEACPSFRGAVEQHRRDYEEELLYVMLGDLARHLRVLFQRGETTAFPEIARVVERLHVEGDHNVRESATIGLLEGIQNVWSHEVDPECFGRFLLPESRKWWDELNAFWQGERHYVGEGLVRELSADDIQKIRDEMAAQFKKH